VLVYYADAIFDHLIVLHLCFGISAQNQECHNIQQQQRTEYKFNSELVELELFVSKPDTVQESFFALILLSFKINPILSTEYSLNILYLSSEQFEISTRPLANEISPVHSKDGTAHQFVRTLLFYMYSQDGATVLIARFKMKLE
jgi:hypothetical protein